MKNYDGSWGKMRLRSDPVKKVGKDEAYIQGGGSWEGMKRREKRRS